jgi:hypothetical protein
MKPGKIALMVHAKQAEEAAESTDEVRIEEPS